MKEMSFLLTGIKRWASHIPIPRLFVRATAKVLDSCLFIVEKMTQYTKSCSTKPSNANQINQETTGISSRVPCATELEREDSHGKAEKVVRDEREGGGKEGGQESG